MQDSQPNAYAAPQSSPDGGQPLTSSGPLAGYPSNSGVNWFFWIAILSMINSLMNALAVDLNFLAGLFSTAFVDGLARALAEGEPDIALPTRAVAFVVSMAIAALFLGFGMLGRRLQTWAIAVGIAAFLLDTLIGAALALWWEANIVVGLVIHAIALFGLCAGFKQARADLAARTQAIQAPLGTGVVMVEAR